MQLEFPVYGVEGEEAASMNSVVVRAYNNDDLVLKVGYLVTFDPRNNSCRRPSTKAHVKQSALGIVLSENDKIEFEPSSPINILRRGRIYVHLESPVKAAGEAVFVNCSTGEFGGNETPNTVRLPQAFFLSSGKKGDVIMLELDLLGEDYRDEDYRRVRV